MLGWTLVAGCVLLAGPAAAELAPIEVHYDGYAKGLHVFDVDVSLLSQPSGSYRMEAGFQLVGVLGAIVHASGTTVVDGRFTAAGPVPRQLFSNGQFRGTPHVMQIDWQDGRPRVVQLTPPPDVERDPVPDAEQAHTTDSLSAVAGLLRLVNQTGRCESASRTFDGQKLVQFNARTDGMEELPTSDRSPYAGTALRCDVTGQMVAGFAKGDDRAQVGKPKTGSAWLARVAAGGPLVPVRIIFYSDGAPVATLYLRAPAAKPS